MEKKQITKKEGLTDQILKEFISNIEKNNLFGPEEIIKLEEMSKTGDLKKNNKVKKFIKQERGEGK